MGDVSDAAGATPLPAGPEIVLRNGRIWTDLACPPDGGPTAIAISNGLVLAIGDEADAAGWSGPATTVVDLGGRRVVPGLIDSHIHAVRAGLSYLDELDWTGVRSLAEALETIRAAADARPAGTWIPVIGGWHPTQFRDEPRMPTPAELTAIAPRHPVFVQPLYGHDDFASLSAAALEALGLDATSADPAGGSLGRNPDGSLDGTARGLGYFQEIARTALQPTTARSVESSRAFFRRLASLGMTGVVDAGGLGMAAAKYRPIRALWREGGLPIRVRLNHGAVTRGAEVGEVGGWLDMLDPGLGDDLLSVLGVGEVLNFGCHDWEGMDPFPIPDDAHAELVTSLREAARLSWPVTVHAILDSSIDRILDAIEEIDRERPVAPLRWNLCHAECISTRNLERVRRLGLGLALQSRLSHKAGVCAERWGEEVVRHAPPLGDIRAAGIPFGGGTDSTRGASYHPWHAIWWFVTGESLDGGPRRDPEHRLDRASALDAYTRGSAWFSFEDDRRGVLRPGALADLAVLDRDYFAVPEAEIPAIAADLTIVAGRVVHRTADFDGLAVQEHGARPRAVEPQSVAAG